MTKQKFNVLVTRTDEYEIEIDTDVWTPENIKEWSKVYSEAETAADIAGIVARRIVYRDRPGEFFEGFGHLKIFKEYENETQLLRTSLKDSDY